ncbi:MAG: hypothetical protein WBR26_16840 [Candidatus Acidiferrum sp.]
MRVRVAVLALSILLAMVPAVTAQDSPDALPKVVEHSQPIYPPLARHTRIQGDVRLKIVIDGESVRDVIAETGHPCSEWLPKTMRKHGNSFPIRPPPSM